MRDSSLHIGRMPNDRLIMRLARFCVGRRINKDPKKRISRRVVPSRGKRTEFRWEISEILMQFLKNDAGCVCATTTS